MDWSRFCSVLQDQAKVLDAEAVLPVHNNAVPVQLPLSVDASALAESNPLHSGEKAAIKLKSLREPKFEVEYSVRASDTVFAVKEKLVSDEKVGLPAELRQRPQDITFLLKGKVVNDCMQAFELANQQLVVAVRHETPSAGDLPVLVHTPDFDAVAKHKHTQSAEPAAREYPGLNDQFWHEVELIAQRYVPDAHSVVAQLRSNAGPNTDLDLD